MKNIISFFLVAILLVSSITTNAQEEFKAHFSGRAAIEGKPVDSISFTLIPEFMFNYLNSRILTFVCDSTGVFDAEIPLKNALEHLDIVLHGAKKIAFVNQYIEDGDKIILEFNGKDKFSVFSGKGASKYNCIEELNYNRSVEHFTLLEKDTLYNKHLGLPIGYERKVLAESLGEYLRNINEKIIQNYAANISTMVLGILKEVTNARYKKGKIELLSLFYFERKDSVRDEGLKKYFYENLPFLEERDFDTIGTNLSKNQVDFLYYLSRTKLSFKNDTYKVSIKDTYNQLIADYDGLVREKVITYYLLRNPTGNSVEYKECLQDAINRVSSTAAKQFLKQMLDGLQSRLYELAMPDSTGSQWLVDDFKGKVVLIDFWFTGCIPCLELAKTLHDEVVPILEKESNVVFLTINLDKKREQWITSLVKGKYTNPLSVNLWTEGKAFEHPFIKYYGLQGLPVLFLIDKDGKIISSNLSREPNEIVTLIQKYL